MLAFGLDKDGGHATQRLLSGDGSNPAAHWHARDVGPALVDILTAFATQEQWLDPVALTLLRRGQGRHCAMLLTACLKVEEGQGAQAWAAS